MSKTSMPKEQDLRQHLECRSAQLGFARSCHSPRFYYAVFRHFRCLLSGSPWFIDLWKCWGFGVPTDPKFALHQRSDHPLWKVRGHFFPTFGDGFMFARLLWLLWFQEMYAKFAKSRSQVWWECMMIRLFFNTFWICFLAFKFSSNAMEIVKMHFGRSSVYYIAAETLDSPECWAHLTQIKEAVLEVLEDWRNMFLQIMRFCIVRRAWKWLVSLKPSETFALLQDHQKESIATILTVNSRTPDSESLGKDGAATWGLHKPVKNLGKLYQNQVRLNLVSTKDYSTIFPEQFRGWWIYSLPRSTLDIYDLLDNRYLNCMISLPRRLCLHCGNLEFPRIQTQSLRSFLPSFPSEKDGAIPREWVSSEVDESSLWNKMY